MIVLFIPYVWEVEIAIDITENENACNVENPFPRASCVILALAICLNTLKRNRVLTCCNKMVVIKFSSVKDQLYTADCMDFLEKLKSSERVGTDS